MLPIAGTRQTMKGMLQTWWQILRAIFEHAGLGLVATSLTCEKSSNRVNDVGADPGDQGNEFDAEEKGEKHCKELAEQVGEALLVHQYWGGRRHGDGSCPCRCCHGTEP